MNYVYLGVGILFVVLLGALGVQTYRLQGAEGTLSLARAEINARNEAAAREDARQIRNKERTDEEFAAARKRALAIRLQRPPEQGPIAIAADAGSSDQSTVCYGRGKLEEELNGWVTRLYERFSGVAQQGEEVAAAYRACRAWALDLGAATPRAPRPDGAAGSGVVAAEPQL